jgi:hypothetical protein
MMSSLKFQCLGSVDDETDEAMFDLLDIWSVETPRYPA